MSASVYARHAGGIALPLTAWIRGCAWALDVRESTPRAGAGSDGTVSGCAVWVMLLLLACKPASARGWLLQPCSCCCCGCRIGWEHAHFVSVCLAACVLVCVVYTVHSTSHTECMCFYLVHARDQSTRAVMRMQASSWYVHAGPNHVCASFFAVRACLFTVLHVCLLYCMHVCHCATINCNARFQKDIKQPYTLHTCMIPSACFSGHD